MLLEKRNAARCQHHKKKTINAFQQIPFFSTQKRGAFAQVADVKLSRISMGMTANLLVIAAKVTITVEWHEKHHRASHGLRTRRFFKTPGLYTAKRLFFFGNNHYILKIIDRPNQLKWARITECRTCRLSKTTSFVNHFVGCVLWLGQALMCVSHHTLVRWSIKIAWSISNPRQANRLRESGS